MSKLPLRVGEMVSVVLPGAFPHDVAIANRIGNYVLLENGFKFHILDDRRKDGFWHLEAEEAVIMEQA
jgi:hypothetical protein